MRIAFAGLKGGVGKSTSAVHVAAGLVALGQPVLLIDADPQGSALRWHERAEFEWRAFSLPTKTIHRQIDRLAGSDHVVIDTPPGDLGIVTSALRSADTLIVPVQPTAADMDQLAETLSLAEDVSAINDLRVLILLTRVVKGTKAQAQTRATLVDAGLNVMVSEVPQSQALALSHGQPIDNLGVYADVVEELLEGEISLMAKDNSISAAFSQGSPRRRKAGEKSGLAASLEDEKLLTVAIPLSLHRELKSVAAQADLTMKEVVMNGILSEIGRLKA